MDIFERLAKRGFSDAEIFRATGIHPSTLCRWRNKLPASIRQYEQLRRFAEGMADETNENNGGI